MDAGPHSIRPGRRAAGQSRRNRARRTAADRRWHAVLSRPDGAAAYLPAWRRAFRPAAPQGRTQRGGGYRLCVPHRFQYARGRGTGPPSGIASVGGYRFPLHDLKEIAGRVEGDATIAALPDPLVGQRLIGNAADRNTMQAALGAVGVNPLVVATFRDRSDRDAASAERRE